MTTGRRVLRIAPLGFALAIGLAAAWGWPAAPGPTGSGAAPRPAYPAPSPDRGDPDAPRIALLVTSASGDRTDLLVQPVDARSPAAPSATVRHGRGGAVRGAVVPGTDTVVVVAMTTAERGRDSSWQSVLFVADGAAGDGARRGLADRLYTGQRPVTAAGGRVFVARGRAGPEPGPAQAARGDLRRDAIVVDELTLPGGRARTVHSVNAEVALPIGIAGDELVVFRSGVAAPDGRGRAAGSDLIAVHLTTGKQRTLAARLSDLARDFSMDTAQKTIVFADLAGADAPEEARWQVQQLRIADGTVVTRARGPNMRLAPHAWIDDTAVLFNDQGRRGLTFVRRGPPVVIAPLGVGLDVVRDLLTTEAIGERDAWIAGLHSTGEERAGPTAFVVETATGRKQPLAVPPGRVDVAGFLGKALKFSRPSLL